jgi:hypothetical protein
MKWEMEEKKDEHHEWGRRNDRSEGRRTSDCSTGFSP